MTVHDLEQEGAPLHVFRWVAWGSSQSTQRRRADLVILLRRSVERRLNGWLEERHFSAAWAVLEEARNEARRRGGIMPDATGIPLDAFRAAVEGATKNKGARTATERPSYAPAEVVSDDEAEIDCEGSNDVVEEDAVPLVSEGLPMKRASILRCLSDALRAAVACRDVEAAGAVNDAISLLCVARKAG